MLQFTVNAERCTRCGKCAWDCPTSIIRQEGDALPFIAPEDEQHCLQCQHCLALCPTAAISILGRDPADSLPLSPGSLPRLDQMTRLIRARRSIRHYRNENVDPALLRQLLTTLANAPSGVNRRALTFTVIDDKDIMQRFRERVLAELVTAAAAGRLPERFTYLRDAPPAYYEQGKDLLFRSAPHALIVSAPPDAPCPVQDIALALAYFDLLAHTAGLGTVWWGMLAMVLATLPELKPLLDLPPTHHFYGMLFGPPDITFARTVQRDDAAVIRRAVF